MLRAKSIIMLLSIGLIASVNLASAQTEECCEIEKDVESKIKIIKLKGMEGDHFCKEPGDRPMIPDLTEEQKEKIETLKINHMEKMMPMKNEMGEKQARLKTLTTAEKVNMSEVNKLIESIGSLCTKIMKLQAQHRQDVRELLTDKQRVIFDAHGPVHGCGMDGKMKMHHPGPK